MRAITPRPGNQYPVGTPRCFDIGLHRNGLPPLCESLVTTTRDDAIESAREGQDHALTLHICICKVWRRWIVSTGFFTTFPIIPSAANASSRSHL